MAVPEFCTTRKIGVIGYGRIGREIINLLKSFTDKILVRSNHLTPEEARKDGVTKS